MERKVDGIETQLKNIANQVKPLKLSAKRLGRMLSRFLTSCDPIATETKRQCPQRKETSASSSTTTLDPEEEARPEVKRWGDVLKGMIDYCPESIPPQALAYAFESFEGPDERPGVLLQSLMHRFESCVGVGDALRDATTAAKVNGCVTDFSWENHIRPFFKKVRELLKFEEDLTESANEANKRREGMVPYAQFVTWAIPKSKEYPTGRSVLTTMLRPQLSEFVRSCCGLTGVLGHLFHHNLEGVATDVRENVKLVLSWIIDATVIGKSKLGNKNRILHHTRGGFKLIVNGRISRSPYSIEEFLLMTGNDHFLEVQDVITHSHTHLCAVGRGSFTHIKTLSLWYACQRQLTTLH